MSNILHGQEAAQSEILSHLAENVRRARTAAGISQDALAGSSGVSRRMISAIESGFANVSLATVDRLASALKLPFSSLIRAPGSTDSRNVRSLAWKGELVGSEAVLLGAAPGGGETEMWLWALAPGERYSSEAGSDAWHEMLFLIEGRLTIELDREQVHLEQGDFRIFSSPAPYAFCNEGAHPVRFIRNVALMRQATFSAPANPAAP